MDLLILYVGAYALIGFLVYHIYMFIVARTIRNHEGLICSGDLATNVIVASVFWPVGVPIVVVLSIYRKTERNIAKMMGKDK